MLSRETEMTLKAYVDGNLSNRDLVEWLAQAEYDRDLPESERDQLASLSLVATEEAEGLRSGDEILDEVAAIMAADSATPEVRITRSSASTTWLQARNITDATVRVRHAGT